MTGGAPILSDRPRRTSGEGQMLNLAVCPETCQSVKIVLEEAQNFLAYQHATVLAILEGGTNTNVKACKSLSEGGDEAAYGRESDRGSEPASPRNHSSDRRRPQLHSSSTTSSLSAKKNPRRLSKAGSTTSKCSNASHEGYIVAPVWADGPRNWSANSVKAYHVPIHNAQRPSDRASRCFSPTDTGGVRQPTRLCSQAVLHPNGAKRTAWDIFVMAMVTYEMIVIPFGLFEPRRTLFLVALEWLARLFWSVDIPMSFISGYIAADGIIEMRSQKIARTYLRSWFTFDVAMVTIDWVEACLRDASAVLGVAGMGKVSRILRMLRMVRVIRLMKASDIVSRIAENVATDHAMIMIDVFKPFCLMLFIGHFVACLWYAIGRDGPQGNNWLEKHDMLSMSIHYRYTVSVRWALSQFSGGTGEILPVSFLEHLFSASVWMGAWWFSTGVLSILTSQLTQLYNLARHHSQQLHAINKYLERQNIPKGLALRIVRNAQYTMRLQRERASESIVGIADLVSVVLLTEMHFEMYHPVLGPHRLFAALLKDNGQVVRKVCHAAVSQKATPQPGDTIFQGGDVAEYMIFITVGSMTYINQDMAQEEVVAGYWVSEAVLWTQWRHLGNLEVQQGALCVHLNAEAFRQIVTEFELFEFDPSSYAHAFVERLNCQLPEEHSDLSFDFEWEQSDDSSSDVSMVSRTADFFSSFLPTRFSFSSNKVLGKVFGKADGGSSARSSTLSSARPSARCSTGSKASKSPMASASFGVIGKVFGKLQHSKLSPASNNLAVIPDNKPFQETLSDASAADWNGCSALVVPCSAELPAGVAKCPPNFGGSSSLQLPGHAEEHP